jgi:C_GCAxxG_C_C family probable redox protein
MGPEEMKQKAIELFEKRFHCSQAVLTAGQEKLDRVDEEVVKSMGAFGGGIASSGRVCGALIGGIALISSLYSRGNLQDKEDPQMWHLSRKLVKRFEELTAPFGGVECNKIAQTDWFDAQQVKEFYKNPESRRKHCIGIVGETAYMLGEILEEAAAAHAAGKN